MRDEPTGEHLLDTARTLLREELIPALPAEKRHAALMIANAMSIAMRQLHNGDEQERQEVAALERLLFPAGGIGREAGSNTREHLTELNRRLCHWIREGQGDAGEFHDAARRHLLEVARHKLAESNPKYLGSGR